MVNTLPALAVNDATTGILTKTWTYPIDLTANTMTEGTYVFTLTATDAANRTSSVTRTVMIDETAPTVAYSSDTLTNLGKWQTKTAVTVSGTAADTDGDAHSGLAKTQYSLNYDSAHPALATWADLTGPSPWAGTITFPESASNNLYLRSIDNAGNVSAVTSAVTVQVDATAPDLDIDASTTVSVINCKSDVSFVLAASDATSGLKEVSASFVTGTDFSAKATSSSWTVKSGSTKNATVTIPAATLDAQFTTDGAKKIYFRVSDAATNISSVIPYTFTVDKSAPTGAVASPATDATVNKLITVSGTANDSNLSTSPGTFWVWKPTTPGASNASTVGAWEPASSGSISGTTSWTVSDFNTVSYLIGSYDASSDSGFQLLVGYLASDTAGNTTYITRVLNVDQNSDRPNIKITTLSSDGGILKYGDNAQISGTVSDDDSTSSNVVGTFIASGVPITSPAGATGTTTYTPTTGEWTYKPADTSDGLKTVYFYIVDNNGAVFYTGNSDTLNDSYIQFKSASKTDNSTVITYRADSNAPTIQSVGGSYGSTDAVVTNVGSLTISLCLGGPNNRYLKIVSKSTDANGIKGMKLSFVDASTTTKNLATSTDFGTTLSGSFAPTTDSTSAVWTTDAIDLSSITTGAVSVTVTAYDQCGLYSNSTSMFNLDNAGPTVTVMSPLSSDEVTGSVAVSGSTSDTGNAGVASIAWLVPSSDDRALSDTALAALSTWQSAMPATATLTAWEFDFNGSDAATKPLLTRYDSENTDGKTYYTSLSGGIYTLPLYFRITDNVGNATIYRNYTIKHNPDGDKPVTKITSPSADDYKSGNDYVTLGGTIRVNGTATDNVSVNRVYLQIDWNGDGVFDSADQAYVAGSGYYTSALANYASSLISSGVDSGDQASWWGIKASNTTGWSISLNANSELNPTSSLHVSGFTSLRDVSIRACAVDNNNKAGAWTTPVKIRIDNLAPRVGSSVQQINRYADSVTLGNFTASSVPSPVDSSDYKADMYLKGQWYLVASVEDESGISSCGVKKGGTTLTAGTDYIKIAHTWTAATTTSGYILYIPLATADGAQDYTVTATDADTTSHTTEAPYTVKIDTTAPTVTLLKGNGSTLTSSTPIQDSNYRFTLSSDATDNGSGFKRALVYFYRDQNGSSTGANRRMYDPMINYATSPATSKVTVRDSSGTVSAGVTEETVAGKPLYGVTYVRSGSSDSVTTFTASSGVISANPHIRKGGLVEIGGSYRLITSISGDTVTFTPGTPTTNTSAFFPYAQVVDNTVAENVSWSGGVYTIDSGDDGDGMPESISKSGTAWSWEATLYSKYIPDGPITAVCFSFDEVGNVSVTTVTTNIQNNRPRLSKLNFGTDLNGDAKYSDSEFETYDMYHVSGDYQSTYNLKTSGYSTVSGSTVSSSTRGAFKVKDTLAVVPEFVGGNGTINLVYTQNASSVSDYQTGSVRNPSTKSTYTPGSNNTIMTAASQMYVLTNVDVTGKASYTDTDDGINKAMAFTFWDSTDETTSGTNSQWAFVKVTDFTVDVTDGNKPKVVINPFYWNSKTDNSLYDAVNGNGQTNGHIELPADLPSSTFASTGEYDLDPKVSGKIVLRGTAYDDQRLSSLWVHFDNFTPVNYLATNVNYGALGVASISSNTYYKVAQFDSSTGTWAIATATMAANNWAFTVSDLPADGAYFNQTGHKVYWTLSIDTSKMTSNPAATDVNARVVAIDHVTGTGNASDTGTSGTAGTDSSYNVPFYQMDVVPYIRGIKTSLSTLKKTIPSVYDRTALGHYPVKSDLNAYLYGFNLAATATVSDSAVTAHTAALGSADTATYSGYTVYPAAVSSFVSGAISVTVNGVVTLNNANSNEAKGSYSGTSSSLTGDYTVYSNYYNRQPNNDNNNKLTDDVVFDVWKVKNSARSHSGTLTEPIMRILPTADTASDKDVMRFAFTNGADYFSMASAADKVSYQDWQRNYADFNNVAFAYDSEGNSYGIATGLDTYPNGTGTLAGRLTFISSRWGIGNTGDMNDNYYGYHKLRLEAIGIMKGANVQGTALADDYILDTRRFSSPVLATAVHSGTGTSAVTSVYLAYYDKFQKQIRFRYGTFKTTAPEPTGTSTSSTGNFNQFKDQHAQGDVNDSADPHYLTTNNNDNAKWAFDAALTDYSLIAGKSAVTTPVDTGNVAGKYVAIDVVPGTSTATDVVVAVWYDGSDLKYSYKLNPYTDNDADQSANAGTSGYWSIPKTIFTDGGKYCAIKVDSGGGIHIAAQDSSNQDLKYAYLSRYDAAYSEAINAVTVDSYSIVGTQIQIDTEKEGSNIIPYISYYNGATLKPKMAYLVPQTTMDYTATGSDFQTEMYTGKWEVTLVPTSSEVQDDHINIGLWKTTAGVKRTNVQTGTDSIASATGYSYGNGTANPVVGYAMVNGTQGYIETAQKQ